MTENKNINTNELNDEELDTVNGGVIDLSGRDKMNGKVNPDLTNFGRGKDANPLSKAFGFGKKKGSSKINLSE